MTAYLAEQLAPVSLDLALGHDVRLADEPSPESSGLRLVPKGRGGETELLRRLGQGEHLAGEPRGVGAHRGGPATGVARRVPKALLAEPEGEPRLEVLVAASEEHAVVAFRQAVNVHSLRLADRECLDGHCALPRAVHVRNVDGIGQIVKWYSA